MQRADVVACGKRLIGGLGGCEGVSRIDAHEGVELGLVCRDASECRFRDLNGRHLARGNCRGSVAE